MRSVSVGRRPAITSSSSSSCGAVASARATSSRLRSGKRQRLRRPLRACRTGRAGASPRARVARRARDVGRAQQRADHDVVFHGQRRKRPHDLERARDAAPADLVGAQPVDPFARNVIAPSSGRSAPAIMLNRVVLPAPFGPITAKISPLATSQLTRSTATQPAEALRHARDGEERAHRPRSSPRRRASHGQMPSGSSTSKSTGFPSIASTRSSGALQLEAPRQP